MKSYSKIAEHESADVHSNATKTGEEPRSPRPALSLLTSGGTTRPSFLYFTEIEGGKRK